MIITKCQSLCIIFVIFIILNDKIFFNPEESDCKIPVHWPILKGFVASEKFFLFGKDYIYVFDENVYHQSSPEKSYPIKSQSYDSFFICPGKIPSPLIAISYLTLAMLTIIIFGFIILIILLAVKSLAIRQRKSSSLSAYLLLFFAWFRGMCTDVCKIGNDLFRVFSFTGTRFTTNFFFWVWSYLRWHVHSSSINSTRKWKKNL